MVARRSGILQTHLPSWHVLHRLADLQHVAAQASSSATTHMLPVYVSPALSTAITPQDVKRRMWVVQADIMKDSLRQMAEASVGEMSNDLKLAEAVNEATRAHIHSLSTSLDGWAPLQEVRLPQAAMTQWIFSFVDVRAARSGAQACICGTQSLCINEYCLGPAALASTSCHGHHCGAELVAPVAQQRPDSVLAAALRPPKLLAWHLHTSCHSNMTWVHAIHQCAPRAISHTPMLLQPAEV